MFARKNHFAFTRLIYQWYALSWIHLKRNLFLQSVFNVFCSRMLDPNRPNSNHPNMRDYWQNFYESFQVFWTDPMVLVSFSMSSCFTRSVFCCWCWKCCAAAIDKKVLSPRRLELRTLCVWGTRDNHYTMVTLSNFSRLSSARWLCNMLVVDVKAVSSNGLLETTLVPNIYTRLDYQAVLVKGSHYPVGIGILSFWFIFVVLRLQFSLLDFVC